MLAALASLFTELFKICPNGVLPSLKLSLCLQKLHAGKPIYFTGEVLDSWSSTMGGWIRMIAADFRAIGEDDDKRRICFAKAGEEETQKILEVLETMSLSTSQIKDVDEETQRMCATVRVVRNPSRKAIANAVDEPDLLGEALSDMKNALQSVSAVL